MRHVICIAFVAGVIGLGPASAQTGSAGNPLSQGSLSTTDRAAISSILDALATRNADALKQAVQSALDNLGTDAPAVVQAVKLAAGVNLPKFQSVLVQNCLGGGDKYCKLAALQAPNTNSDIQTAATSSSGDGGGNGGGGGFGGTPQVNQGHNGGFFGGSGSSNAASRAINFANFGQSFPVTNFGGSTSAVTTTTISAPGPVVGSGWMTLIALLGWRIWRRRVSRGL